MANEKRLIDANATIDAFTNWLTSRYDGRLPRDIVAELPTVDAVEVVHGRWKVRRMTDIKIVEVKCSACGWLDADTYDAIVDYFAFNYCPNCGAKMDGDGNG